MPILEQTVGPEGGDGLQRRLFAGTHQSRRQAAPLRDHHQGRLGAECRRRSISSPTVYGSVVTAGIHRAPSIKVAEAAKVIENTQRDLNIAFMNELSLIFQALDIDTGDVLAAAAHQMEFPAVPAGPGRRSLHRRRSLLSDLPRREGRLSSRSHPGRPPHQRRHGPAHRARMHPRPAAPEGQRRHGHDPRHDLQGERARYPQFAGDRHRAGTAIVRRRGADRRSAGGCRRLSKHEYGVALTELDALQPADAVILAVAHDRYIEGGWPLIQQLLRDGERPRSRRQDEARSRAQACRHRAVAALTRTEQDG